MKELFCGSCVALITPFKKGKIDYQKLEEILDFQLLAGTDAILLLGTTGESATVRNEEREEIIRFARRKIPQGTKLLVGTGSNSTDTAIKFSQKAERLGADGLLVVTPYYNKCTQNGLFLHYQKISKSVHIPIILYNVPSRTGVNIEPETAEKLSEIENIVGIKEANSDMDHIKKMMEKLKDKLAVYSGNDDLNYDFLSLGARGVISVSANLFPELVKEVTRLYFSNQKEEAFKLHQSLKGLNESMFVEVNPIPVKFGASTLDLCENELRLPLTPLQERNEDIVKKEIEKLKGGK